MITKKGYTIAIRFNRSFSIVDNFGAIMDKILYDSVEAFSNNVYVNCETFLDARVLTNSDGSNKLTINSENFILDVSKTKDFDAEFEKHTEAFQKVIAENIMNDYNVRKINRFGCVIKTEIDKSDNLFLGVSSLISEQKKEPDSLSLRFNCSKNKPKEIKGKMIGDYKNEIITYGRSKKDNPVEFTVDYQYYFRPALTKIKDSKLKFSTFCQNSLTEFSKEYPKS